MNRIIKILVLLLVGFSVKAQTPVPVALPSPNNTSYSKIGWSRADSGIINAPRDTTLRPKYIGTQIIWPHSGADTNVWYWDGGKFFRYLRTGADVINALGYTPLQNITAYISAGSNVTLSGSGTLLNPYVINSSGGGGGGGSVNSFAFTNGNGFAGTVLNSTTTPTLSLSVSVTGLLYGNGTALGATTIGAGLSFSGGTLTNTINNTNQLTNGAGFITNATGLISAGTNITITGSGTSGSPYVINSSGGGGGITGAGNLSPLFTTSITSSTLNFALTNATAHRFYGNFTGSSAAPSFGTPSLDGGDFFNDGTTTTVLHGNAAGNLSFGKVSLGAGGDASGILDTLKGGTGVASPHFNFGYGILATGNFPNYNVSLDTANLKDTIRLFYNGATGDTLMHSLGGNLYSPRFIDSANFHHYFKADGTLVFYATGGGGSGLAINAPITSGKGKAIPFGSPTSANIGNFMEDSTNFRYDSAIHNLYITGSIGINSTAPATGVGIDIQLNNPSFRVNNTGGNNAAYFANYSNSAMMSANWQPGTSTYANASRTAAYVAAYDGTVGVSNVDIATGTSISANPTVWWRMYGNGNVVQGSTLTDNSTAVLQVFKTTTQLALHNTSSFVTTFFTNSSGGLDMRGLTALTYPTAAFPTGTTTDSVLVETTSAGVATIKKVAQSSISGSGSGLTRQSITSGSSGTVTGGNYLVKFDFSSVAASYSLTTPASPADQDIVEIQTGKTITAPNPEITSFTIVANSGQTLNFAVIPITLNSGENVKIRYNSTGSYWDRLR